MRRGPCCVKPAEDPEGFTPSGPPVGYLQKMIAAKKARGSGAFFVLATVLWLAALGRDRVDAWIDATVLPPLDAATSVEVRDREGALLRAYTVGNGLWRLKVGAGEVDLVDALELGGHGEAVGTRLGRASWRYAFAGIVRTAARSGGT